jgi:hypothetical protein
MTPEKIFKHFFGSTYSKYQVLLIFCLLANVAAFAQSNPTMPDSGNCLSGNCTDGIGEKLYADKGRFTGLFEGGGKKFGTYLYPNGDLYFGHFTGNRRVGNAQYQYKNGNLFTGWYNNDEKEFGKFQQTDGNIYEGTWFENKPHGYGKITNSSGQVWEGVFEAGEKRWGAFVGENSSPLDTADLDVKSVSGDLMDRNSQPFPRVFAVVVGLSNYQGTSSDLTYSDDDARHFYQYLTTAMSRETKSGKVVLLQNEQATASTIRKTVREVFSQSTENDIILFYFSGHGSEEGFIPFEIFDPVKHEEIRGYFRASKAAYRLCIADACFSGAINQGNSQSTFASLSNLSDSRIAVIMSSKPSQTSQETSLFKQGVFSYFLVKGLRGSGDLNKDTYVTAAELFLYTKNKVVQFSKGTQVPVISGNNLHRIPLAKITR